MTTNRIDVHHHYVPAELVDELDRVGIHHVGGQPLTPSQPADLLGVMDRYEIATALLSVPIPLTLGDTATSRRVARRVNEAGAEAVADNAERYDTVLGCLHELVPSTHILLGTDYPMAREIGVASTLAGLEGHAGFDDDDRRAIESDSARQLFPRLNNWAARIPRADFAGAGPT